MLNTQQIVSHCRDKDRDKPYRIMICWNAETLSDGYWDGGGPLTKSDYSNAVAAAGVEFMGNHDRAADVDFDFDRSFQNWHGGRHYKAGSVIGEIRWGHNAGWVVTHEQNPPQWLCDLIDEMSNAMVNEATQIGEDEDASE